MFYFADWTYLLLIPGILLSMYAQARVSSAFNKYSQVRTQNGITGGQAAREIMIDTGIASLRNIKIVPISGELTDNYNPATKLMSLSQNVINSPTVAAVGVAAHETGHAIQDAVGYWPMKFRNAIVPVSGFCSQAAWPLFFIGLIFGAGKGSFGYTLMNIGIILYLVAFLFYLITLPVEFDASRRAVKTISEYGILPPEDIGGVKRVLSAAALTYVASMLTSLLTLIRLLVLRDRRS